ncbi:MAG: flippase-like domain-containing protein, partial [Acidimicrobiales bacterium]|nr:flippase-like domain-containing protein [Acidimicrobiales bacterium]
PRGANRSPRPWTSSLGRIMKAAKPWVQRAFTVAVIAAAVAVAIDRRHEVAQASHLIAHLRWDWLALAIACQLSSMVVFARLQRWLLRAGGVHVGLWSMVEITFAGNALGTSLPGGAAWSATWAFGQLRRRGADRVLAGWVILVAGALASFALFVLLAAGAFLAGSRGPVASFRVLAGILAAIPVVVGLTAVALHRSARLRRTAQSAWGALTHRWPPVRRVGDIAERFLSRLRTVQPGPLGWIEAFGLALANWVYDAATLVACLLALGAGVPWRGVLVAYALTQVAASLPITPGGLGVVEGSLAALLVAYGLGGDQALAVTLLYRLVSFWGLVPIGWASWATIELAQRQGARRKVHPWAVHHHGPVATGEWRGSEAPDRVLEPAPCEGCDEEARPESPDERIAV